MGERMFLEQIVAEKRDELEQRQRAVPLTGLKAAIREKPLPLDLASAISGDGLRLIAEVKRASPSRGVLRSDLDPLKLAETYARCGAAAISVLTESRYFGGSGEDLEAIRGKLPNTPLLRKDFILKPYQILESRAWGADAVLLIVSILSDRELKELLSLTQDLGMQCLVEVHNKNELERALKQNVRIIGINNRNLNTMAVDLNVTRRLRPLVSSDRLVVSESGIKGREDVQKLKEWRVNAVLVGEALVTADHTAAKIKELL
jgi:indole-3-glycerol phosphate synthase